tara:strand:+ start:49 stop:468 length:420 start_codon:yes stop_codon:yes gene_type:complete
MYIYKLKLAAPRKDFYIWPPFSQYIYNKHLLRQKTGGTCLYMPQDGHWLASFEVIPPPKLVFPRPKKQNSPALKTGCSRPLLEKNAQTHFFSSSFLAVFVGNSSLLKKVEKFRPKLRLSCFSGESFGTILSRRYRLSRT